MTIEQTTATDPAGKDVETIALRFYPPLRDGDTSGAAAFLSSGWQDIPLNDGQTPGPAGYAEMVGKLRGFLPDLEWTIDDVIVGTDKVVVRSTIRGTPQGTWLGIHLTGHRVAFSAIDIHAIQDGKIVTTWHVEDKLSILQQIGLPHISL